MTVMLLLSLLVRHYIDSINLKDDLLFMMARKIKGNKILSLIMLF